MEHRRLEAAGADSGVTHHGLQSLVCQIDVADTNIGHQHRKAANILQQPLQYVHALLKSELPHFPQRRWRQGLPCNLAVNLPPGSSDRTARTPGLLQEPQTLPCALPALIKPLRRSGVPVHTVDNINEALEEPQAALQCPECVC